MKPNKIFFLILLAIIVYPLILPLFFTNISIHIAHHTSYIVLVKARDAYLTYGDELNFVITPLLDLTKCDISIKPSNIVKIEHISNYRDYTIITA
ncbi:MAG: hypothetical protein J7K21_06065, partial [Desulfurococcales archaeon]|nr:hypothetical protein [Desulfurococcales archaeon]